MARRKVKTDAEKSIPELADESVRKTVRGMCKGGKLFDSSKLKPTMINLGPKPELKDIFNLSDTYPYAKTDRFGNYWRSRNNVEQKRFGPEERAYAHWIPGDAREALQEVIILDEGLSEYDDDKVFNEHLFNLLKCDD